MKTASQRQEVLYSVLCEYEKKARRFALRTLARRTGYKVGTLTSYMTQTGLGEVVIRVARGVVCAKGVRETSFHEFSALIARQPIRIDVVDVPLQSAWREKLTELAWIGQAQGYEMPQDLGERLIDLVAPVTRVAA